MTPEQEYVALHDAPEIGWNRHTFLEYVTDREWTEPELRHLAAWTAKHQAMVLNCYGLGARSPCSGPIKSRTRSLPRTA